MWLEAHLLGEVRDCLQSHEGLEHQSRSSRLVWNGLHAKTSGGCIKGASLLGRGTRLVYHHVQWNMLQEGAHENSLGRCALCYYRTRQACAQQCMLGRLQTLFIEGVH